MERRKLVRLVVGAAAIVLLPALAGCAGHYTQARVVHTTAPRPMAYYEYYYYPDVMVYYHIHTGYYYYFFNKEWRRTRQRPGFLYLDDRRRQSVVIRDAQPYAQHAEHRKKYPAQPIPPGHARNQVPVPNLNRNPGIGNGVVQPGHQPQSQPQNRGVGNGVAQPRYQPQPQNTGTGRGAAQPVTLPQPQNTGAGQGQARNQPQPQAQPQAQPKAQMHPQPQPQPVRQAQPQPVPQSGGQNKAKAVQPCDAGKSKGKTAGACG